MNALLLIDFGSTYTKVTAVDLENAALLGSASAYTTIETDINDGLSNALANLEKLTGPLSFERRFACSSAAGGLRMVTCGLVPELTAEAARIASLGAGAKVIKVFSYQLTDEDIEEIDSLNPDILLLTGGVDGGNSECILHNAEMLSGCKTQFPILLAGNRSVAKKCEEYLAGREIYRCANVMPKIGELNTQPVQDKIRELFLRRIIQAKGLSKAQELISGILMPTPAAMMQAMELLAKGTKSEPGIGELVAVDLGGATTDIYSIAAGMPSNDNTILKGLPEPYSKRTVEGDIGMRYSAQGIADAVGLTRLSEFSGLPEETITDLLGSLLLHPDTLPVTPEQEALDYALASAAIETAVARHAGTLEEVYTPMGLTYAQTGKNLTEISQLIVTGGAIIHTKDPYKIASHAQYNPSTPFSLRPKSVNILVDRKYILAAMGLLSGEHPDCALKIMKKELQENPTAYDPS